MIFCLNRIRTSGRRIFLDEDKSPGGYFYLFLIFLFIKEASPSNVFERKIEKWKNVKIVRVFACMYPIVLNIFTIYQFFEQIKNSSMIVAIFAKMFILRLFSFQLFSQQLISYFISNAMKIMIHWILEFLFILVCKSNLPL